MSLMLLFLRIVCGTLRIDNLLFLHGIMQPWASNMEIFPVLDGLPTPTEWVKWLNKEEIDLMWRYFGGLGKPFMIYPTLTTQDGFCRRQAISSHPIKVYSSSQYIAIVESGTFKLSCLIAILRVCG